MEAARENQWKTMAKIESKPLAAYLTVFHLNHNFITY